MAYTHTFTLMTRKSMFHADLRLYVISNNICLHAYMMYTVHPSPAKHQQDHGTLHLNVNIICGGRIESTDIIQTTAVRDIGISMLTPSMFSRLFCHFATTMQYPTISFRGWIMLMPLPAQNVNAINRWSLSNSSPLV